MIALNCESMKFIQRHNNKDLDTSMIKTNLLNQIKIHSEKKNSNTIQFN